MRKYLILLIFLVFIILIGNSYSQGLKTYTATGPYFNYSIDYPSDWNIGDIYGFIQIISPLKTNSVLVSVADVNKKPMSLEEFGDIWLKIIPQELSNFELLNKGKDSINNAEAIFYLYKGNKNTRNVKCKRYTFKNNTNIYELVYEAKEEDFDKYLPQAESIIRSIKVKE